FFYLRHVNPRYLHSFPTTTLFRSLLKLWEVYNESASFEDLKVWQDARVFVKLNYELTDSENFKKDYGLKDQLQRSVVSIMNNIRSEEHTSELQSRENLVCRLLLEK